MLLCEKCLKILTKNLLSYGYDDDLQIVKALVNNDKLNLEEISRNTKLTISQRRDGIQRLLASLLIKGEKVGNSKIFSLTENGKQLVELIKNNKLEV